MMEKLQDLIEALREELQQYGEMLARLDSHQELATRLATANLLESVANIEAQGAVIQEALRQREDRQRAMTREIGLPDNATFAQLVPLLPAEYRPLLGALAQENNELLARVRQQFCQNQGLPARTRSMIQQIMTTLSSSGAVPACNESTAPPGGTLAPRSASKPAG